MSERAPSRLLALFPALAALLLLGVLAIPLVALVLSTAPADLVAGLRHPLALSALRLSLLTTSLSLGLTLLLGTPLAWWMARHPGPAERVAATLVQLPIVVPPAVSGLALLLAFGRRGLLGPLLDQAGWALPFTTAAVVLAELFVSAPFYVQSAVAAFRRLDEDLLWAAGSLGAGPARRFFRVALPLSRPGVVTGAALSWARALGEFGATLMFAGNLQGRTQTLPLAIYSALETDLRPAKALSILMVAVALAVLGLLGRGTVLEAVRART
ncbi:MAG TPA: ABC transporter permease [Myxococcaceae bacterium]|nr:ABC transporter permease [Myxococcaceae bacterium]